MISNIISLWSKDKSVIDSSMLFDEEIYEELCAMGPAERVRTEMKLEEIAKGMKKKTEFKKFLQLCKKEFAKRQAEKIGLSVFNGGEFEGIAFKTNADGRILDIANNYLEIMKADEHFNNIKFNLLSEMAEIEDGGKVRSFNDTDYSEIYNYIQNKYNLGNDNNMKHAFNLYLRERAYHPIKDIIEAARWDGRERCEAFLIEWLGCEDTAYNREVSRLIFAGGINRIYSPGCKFDTVPVFIGGQGVGKSTAVRWLALGDDYFNEISTFEGKEAVEALQGCFICEVGELLALTRVKDQEGIKAFITRQNDRMRLSYGRFVKSLPRQMIFIGTTNQPEFLRDKTGNRRWLPVRVFPDGRFLYKYEQECKEYILQCWAEALHKLQVGEFPAVANYSLTADIKAAQEMATEEDYRLGLIKDYLETKSDAQTCVIEVWERALDCDRKPARKDCNEIAAMLRQCGWEIDKRASRYQPYGVQKLWRPADDKLPF